MAFSLFQRGSALGFCTCFLFMLVGCPSDTTNIRTGGKKGSSKFQEVKGVSAPSFSLRDLKGRTHSLSQYKNKVVLLNFWATWCEPCKKEFPHFQRFSNNYSKQGLKVLAVSIDEGRSAANVGPTIYRYGYRFTVLLDKEGRVVNLYNPKQHCPYSVLIDRRGQIRMQHQGYNPGDEQGLEKMIVRLLKE